MSRKRKIEKKAKEKAKRTNKSIVILFTGIILILLVVAIFYIVKSGDGDNRLSCKNDSDCVKKQTSCCPCHAGGKEECVNNEYKMKITCPPTNELICPQMYNCREISCSCINGKCSE